MTATAGEVNVDQLPGTATAQYINGGRTQSFPQPKKDRSERKRLTVMQPHCPQRRYYTNHLGRNKKNPKVSEKTPVPTVSGV